MQSIEIVARGQLGDAGEEININEDEEDEGSLEQANERKTERTNERTNDRARSMAVREPGRQRAISLIGRASFVSTRRVLSIVQRAQCTNDTCGRRQCGLANCGRVLFATLGLLAAQPVRRPIGQWSALELAPVWPRNSPDKSPGAIEPLKREEARNCGASER